MIETVNEISPPRTRQLWILAGVFTALVGATYLAFVRTEWGQGVEDAALAGRAVEPQQLIADAWHLLDTISVVALGVVGVVLMGVAVVRKRFALAAAAGVMVLGANVTTQVLKRMVFDRPDLVNDAGELLNNSLPSGHSTVAMSVAVALFLVFPSRFRTAAAVIGAVYAIGIGAAVVAAGWHRPSDAVAAWFVVGAWTAAVLAVLAMSGRMPVMRAMRRSTRIAITVFGALAVVAGAVGIFGIVISDVWYVEGVFNEAHEGTAFITSTLGVAAAGLAMMGVILYAVRGTTIGYRESSS